MFTWKTKPQLPQTRWMTAADLAVVARIEKAAFGPDAWTAGEFEDFFRFHSGANPRAGLVAYFPDSAPCGFVVYSRDAYDVCLVNLAVDPDCRRRKVATYLVQSVLDGCPERHAVTVTADVRERNLPAQLFFKKLGFKAHVVRGAYDAADGEVEDAYRFVLELPPDPHPVGRDD